MGRLRYFRIKLENNDSGIYFGGDTVQGKLLVGLEGDGKKARGIRVEINGESNVHWKERRTRGTGDNRRTETVHYRSSESYINHRQYVIGDSSNTMQIAAGDYEYPFTFTLPLSVPSSFVGEYGRIAYSIKAVIDRPWRFDHETVAFFTVVGVYDLNNDSSAGLPRTMGNNKMLGCLCCTSGPITATVRLDRSGYVPGETIYLQATVDNESDRAMNTTSVEIIQTIIFKANGRTKECETSVLGYTKGAIEPGASDSWEDMALRIPVLPPSELPHCHNIIIKYEIVFRVEPSGIGFDLKVVVPIVIGTIPLRSTFSQFQRTPTPPPPPPTTTITPSAPAKPADADLPPSFAASEAMPSTGPFSLYPDLPPPTYEEARNLPGIRMEDDNENTTGNWDFKPIYPYYG